MLARFAVSVLSCALLAGVSASQDSSSAQDSYDLRIRGAVLIDGTNTARRRADVAILDGRIVAIGELGDVPAARTIEADGLIVAPGFVDLHAHADLEALRRPDAHNFVAMGVTTLITGNCGGSVDDVKAHLAKLDSQGIGVNYGTLIGHGTVRTAVMGTANRAPTEPELAAMQALIARAMDAGAFGMSTGLIYVPGTFAKLDELVALSETVAAHHGIYVSHMRNEGDELMTSVREALEIGRRAKVPIHLSHLKVSHRPSWGGSAALCELLESERKAGTRVTGDQYAYAASSTSLDVLFPSDALSIGRKAFCTQLKDDSEFRELMRRALQKTMSSQGFGDLSYAQIASAPGTQDVAGIRIPELAERLFGGHSEEQQADATIQLMVNSDGRRVSMVYHKMTEADIERIMTLPFVAVASDAGIRLHETADKPHPRGAGNNARVLGHYVRERKVLSLELAIHKMTEVPATTFGLRDRGTLRVGAHADLVIFDADTVLDTATYEAPMTAPVGIPYVFVNGIAVIDDGKPTKALPGQVLRAGVE